ncbi:MAG TPA: sugar transferase, partial [Atribacteraceae bacterium]|nr:sugar transferase [Atribacteraceae bacterium]
MKGEGIGYRTAKRTFDFVISLVGLVILSPLILLVSMWIRRDSPGPIFFRQRRVGRENRAFLIFKFRTMYCTTPNVAKDILLA